MRAGCEEADRAFETLEGIFSLNLSWSWDTTATPVPVRDIYKIEFDLFSFQRWCVFYWVPVRDIFKLEFDPLSSLQWCEFYGVCIVNADIQQMTSLIINTI